MTASSTPTDRLRAILVLLATFGIVGFHYLAAAGLINGTTLVSVFNKYPTLVTPADYAFSIWALIFAGLLAFGVYQLMPANLEKYRYVRTLYLVACVLYSGWLYFWVYDRIVVSFVLTILLGICLFLINRFLRTSKSPGEYWLVNGPFGLYFGWVTALMLVNFAVLLVSWNIQISQPAWNAIAVMIVVLAGFLGVFMRIRLANYFYPLAIAWTLTAIAVKQSGNTPIVLASAVGVVACLIAALSFVLKLPNSDSRVSINEQR